LLVNVYWPGGIALSDEVKLIGARFGSRRGSGRQRPGEGALNSRRN
jgi:hypothetical protein